MTRFTKDPSTHPANGPLTEERLIRVREWLQSSLAYPDGSNRDYMMADAAKAIDELLESRAAPPLPHPAVPDENGLLPCPFCGGKCDAKGWAGISPGGGLAHGPECEDCGSTADSLENWNLRAAMLQGAEHVSQPYTLPMQPLIIDAHGTPRFKENPIVRKLLDYATEHGYGLNEMALEQFDAQDRMQLAQLIGYSLSGYGTLSYVTDVSYARAAAAAPQQEAKP